MRGPALAKLYVTALNPTDAVTEGFLPAAQRLGQPLVLLTDQPDAHRAAYANRTTGTPEIVSCTVRDPRAVVDAILRHGPAAGLLSNSDHLQAPTALAAGLLGLPGKDWRAAWLGNDKALTRRWLARNGTDTVRSALVFPGDEPAEDAMPPFPAVVKPREGVASEDVYLVRDADELTERVAQIRTHRPGDALVVEEYLDGDLYTVETLGDGNGLAVVGSWRTTLGAPPTFVEERMDWAPEVPASVLAQVLAQLDVLGVRLGACHTEYVVRAGQARLIEVNYRLIGDRVDLLLAELLGVPLFEYVIRLHLGEPLSALPLPRLDEVPAHAAVEWVCATRGGRLACAPGAEETTYRGVRVTNRPMRTVGTVAELHHTNRDYLAAVTAVGPDQSTVDAAIAGYRASRRWVIE
jgi:biotin carboxylase